MSISKRSRGRDDTNASRLPATAGRWRRAEYISVSMHDQPLDVPILRNAARSWLDALPRRMRSCIVCSGDVGETARRLAVVEHASGAEAASGIGLWYLLRVLLICRFRRWRRQRRRHCGRRCRTAGF